jgi:hypothetical protein
VDEIYFVNNLEASHPLAIGHYRLERIDAESGRTIGRWPWPNIAGYTQTLSHTFRSFVLGGYVFGRPVLVTAQGTYGDMYLQTWNAGMNVRWQRHVARDEPGARGSHVCPLVDLDADGVEELFVGRAVH